MRSGMLTFDADVHRDGRIAREIGAEGRIYGTIGDRQLVIRLRLLDGLHGGPQVRAASGCARFRNSSSGLDLVAEVERSRDVELLHRSAIVEQHQQLDFRGAQTLPVSGTSVSNCTRCNSSRWKSTRAMSPAFSRSLLNCNRRL